MTPGLLVWRGPKHQKTRHLGQLQRALGRRRGVLRAVGLQRLKPPPYLFHCKRRIDSSLVERFCAIGWPLGSQTGAIPFVRNHISRHRYATRTLRCSRARLLPNGHSEHCRQQCPPHARDTHTRAVGQLLPPRDRVLTSSMAFERQVQCVAILILLSPWPNRARLTILSHHFQTSFLRLQRSSSATSRPQATSGSNIAQRRLALRSH